MSSPKPAKLALEDGTVLEGESFGADGEKGGEVVFNTAMSGYQEILTDPSYKGQIVTMTYPLIGNYGVNSEDVESGHPWVEGFVVREYSRIRSNHRSTEDLSAYLRRHGVLAVEGLDTRAITKRLRVSGALRGVLSTTDGDDASLVRKARAVPSMEGLDLVRAVTHDRVMHWRELVKDPGLAPPAGGETFRVACLDYGIKFNILRSLVRRGCDVTVFPGGTPAAQILEHRPDGVFLSNGPGDPAVVDYAIRCVRDLVNKGLPVFGICLGHQILGLALGAKTYKLKFGHHGANHPVQDLDTGKVEITSQNHGFAVDAKSTEAVGLRVTHLNLNDGAVEGMAHRELPCFSVQYHPEASPGPHDSLYLFERFRESMGRRTVGA